MNTKSKPVINTERLCLRPISHQDKEDMIAILTNHEISKTYMIPVFKSDEEKLQLFEKFKDLSQSDRHFVYGIYLKEKIIGFINETECSETEIELGYVIHPDHQNKGYATEVLQASIKTLFSLGYHAVTAGAFAENPASMRVMEKCQMTRISKEDTILYRGCNHRCIYYRKENDLFPA